MNKNNIPAINDIAFNHIGEIIKGIKTENVRQGSNPVIQPMIVNIFV